MVNSEQTKILRFSSSKLKTIPDLKAHKNVEFLDLSYNSIAKIENLESQKNLQELLLTGNKLKSIENLKGVKKLWKIYLDENQISILDWDELPIGLEVLVLTDNKISKLIKPKKTLPLLNNLSLNGNPISRLEFLEFFPKLMNLGIDGKKIKSISKKTFEFLMKSSQNDEFRFFTSLTTATKDFEKFIKINKIKIE